MRLQISIRPLNTTKWKKNRDMMKFCRKILKKIKLIVLYFTRIVFVKNNFKVSFWNKIKSNVFGGFLADQYVLYDLKNNDKNEYLSEFDWYRSRYINEPFNFAFNNKIVCDQLMKQHIKTPNIYFIKNKETILDMNNNIYDVEDIYHCIIKKKKLFFKPFAMGKGKGVSLLSYENDELYIDLVKVEKNSLLKYLSLNDKYYICEYMEQHEYASKFYNKTVNTIRIIVFRDIKSKKFKIYYAVQRIGNSRTIPVDNASKGGLVANIDIYTGKLSEARCLHDLNQYVIHPESRSKIKGAVIPNWNNIKQRILWLSDKFPYMQLIAWDVLVTEDDICVIEANTSTGINIIQLWEGQRNSEFGEFLKYHKVIK